MFILSLTKGPFPLQELYTGTMNILKYSVPLLVFLAEGKISLNLDPVPKNLPGQRVTRKYWGGARSTEDHRLVKYHAAHDTPGIFRNLLHTYLTERGQCL